MAAPKGVMAAAVLGAVALVGLAYLATQPGSSQATSTGYTSSETASTSSSVAGVYVITTLSNGSVRTISDTATSAVTGPSPCPILGPPNGVYIRILSDVSGSPVVGANVTAVQKEGGPICNGVQYLEGPFTQTFITDGTQWHELGTGNFGDLSVTVKYLGASYNLSARMNPLSVTCATLYVPSGRNNVTSAEYQTSCG